MVGKAKLAAVTPPRSIDELSNRWTADRRASAELESTDRGEAAAVPRSPRSPLFGDRRVVRNRVHPLELHPHVVQT